MKTQFELETMQINRENLRELVGELKNINNELDGSLSDISTGVINIGNELNQTEIAEELKCITEELRELNSHNFFRNVISCYKIGAIDKEELLIEYNYYKKVLMR